MKKWYDAVCEVCGSYDIVNSEFVHIGDHVGKCEWCKGNLVRCIRRVAIKHQMGEHYNPAVGMVKNEAHLKSELSRASDRNSLVTGMDHQYEMVDLREKDALGVTDEGLDSTMKRRRDTGLDPSSRSIIV